MSEAYPSPSHLTWNDASATIYALLFTCAGRHFCAESLLWCHWLIHSSVATAPHVDWCVAYLKFLAMCACNIWPRNDCGTFPRNMANYSRFTYLFHCFTYIFHCFTCSRVTPCLPVLRSGGGKGIICLFIRLIIDYLFKWFEMSIFSR